MKDSLVKKVVKGVALRLGVTNAGYLLGNSPERNFSNHWYIRHNQRRQEHLASLGLDLYNKTVLETGAGVGDHTTFFLDRNCKVTISEPREENLKILKERYPDNKIVKLDLDNPSINFENKFNIVYCYGTLYHLSKPETAIAYLAEQTDELMLLETCVSFGNEQLEHLIAEPSDSPSQAVSGTGCRPTRPWVFNTLSKYFPYIYVPITQPSHSEFPLDWTNPNNQLLNRAVFIASKKEIHNPLLVTALPDKQVYFLSTEKSESSSI